MAHRPVCVKCEVEMRAEKNGVTVIDTEQDKATQLWGADLWKCPKCGVKIVMGFGDKPWASRFDDKTDYGFISEMARCIADGHAYLCAR